MELEEVIKQLLSILAQTKDYSTTVLFADYKPVKKIVLDGNQVIISDQTGEEDE